MAELRDNPEVDVDVHANGVVASDGEVMTIRETAAFLKLSDQHVRRLVEAGQLPGRKLGDRWRFSRQALLRHLEGKAK